MAQDNNDQARSDGERVYGEESGGRERKVALNRRDYVKAGAATMALFTISATAAASDTVVDGNRYWTDFSDGQL